MNVILQTDEHFTLNLVCALVMILRTIFQILLAGVK